MCKIKSQDSLKIDLLTLPRKCVYTHRYRHANIVFSLSYFCNMFGKKKITVEFEQPNSVLIV